MNFAVPATLVSLHTEGAVESQSAASPQYAAIRFLIPMTSRSGLMTDENLRGGMRIAQYGFDITDNIQLRMTRGKESAFRNTPESEKAVASSALTSFREEAIWQYHVRRVRGFVLWTLDQSLAYIPHFQLSSGLWTHPMELMARLCEIIQSYEPASEAIVWSEHEDADELFKISSEDVRLDLFVVSAPAFSYC
jgi:hypothetical protein